MERKDVVVKDIKKKTLGKETVIVALLCLICLSAIAVGNHFLGGNEEKNTEKNKEIINLNADKNEETSKKENLQVDGNVVKEKETTYKKESLEIKDKNINVDNIDDKMIDGKNIGKQNNILKNDNKNFEESDKNISSEVETKNNEEIVVNVNSNVSNLTFTEDDKIDWPVEGNVLLDYSMENTIYFPTLDTYKCNPALIIQSEKGKEVKAGVKGIVKKVSTEDEIGNYIVIEIGNGYELTYGQLGDIKVAEKDKVDAGTCIGITADTTRYYENEGPNLYFKMTKNGELCDPMDYLK